MTDRAKAVAHVADLIARYRSALRHGRYSEMVATFYRERLRSLTRELGELQVAGAEAESAARRWCLAAAL